MKTDAISIAAGVILILIITAAGCIEPPSIGGTGAKTNSSKSPSGIYNPLNPATTTPTPPMYVTEVTPYGIVSGAAVETSPTQEYSVFPVPSPVPQDLSCLIYTKRQTYAYNGTAFTFDLKNPPMYIEYSVIPTNITKHILAPQRSGLKGADVVYVYDEYSPNSWFTITVRNKITGEVYLQDGFGKNYRWYINGTIKVLNTEDLQVEFNGNQITATTRIWAKPLGNFNITKNLAFPECKYWEGNRNVIDMPTATATPTWAYTAVSTPYYSTTLPTIRPN